MAVTVERLIATLEARFDQYEKALDKALKNTNRKFNEIERRGRTLEKRMGDIGLGIGRSFAGALAGVVSMRGAQQLIDSALRIENALKIAGLAGQDLKDVYESLYASAQRYAAPVEALTQLYGRAALAQKELNASTGELLNFTEKVALALRVNGRSAAESAGALIQLSQAIGAGIVRAEEFNSILEGALPIAQAAAAGLKEAGGSVAKLRTLIIDGKVSSEAFFRAFEAGAVILEQKVAGAEMTLAQQFTRLQNVLIDTAGKIDKTTGASERLGGVIDDLAKIVQDFGGIVSSVAESDLGSFIKWLDDVITKADQARKFLGGLSGIMKTFAGVNADLMAGREIGTALREQNIQNREQNIQNRINNAFNANDPWSGEGVSPKGGRIKAGGGVKPVTLDDYPIAGTKPGGGGGGRRRRARENEFEREAAQIRERTAALEAELAVMAQINPLVDDYGYALEKARTRQELLTAAKKAGLQITPELSGAIDALAASYAQASADAERLAEQQDDVRRAAEEMRDLGKDVLGGFIKDLRDGKSASEALAGALQKVADKLLDIALNSIFDRGGGIGGLIGSIFGGGISKVPFGVGLYHSGGVVGRPSATRAVSPSVFAGAQRYHSGGIAGLRPGEVPAILQRGETVIPKGGFRGGREVLDIRVGVSADSNGNLLPFVESVAQQKAEAAAGRVARSVPMMVDARQKAVSLGRGRA